MDPIQMLNSIGRGRLLERIGEYLSEIAEITAANGSPGTVTIKLKVTKGGAPNVVEPLVVVTGSVTKTMPREADEASLFYSVEGSLHREDPRQPKLDLRMVEPTPDRKSTRLNSSH